MPDTKRLTDLEQKVLRLEKELSEARQREKDLQASHRLLKDIFNFLPDAAFAIDTEGVVIAWNRAIEELSGVKTQDMIGKGQYEYAIPFYGKRRPILIDLVLKWDKKAAETYRVIKKQGDTLISESQNLPFRAEASLFWNGAKPLYDQRGNMIGAVEVIRDITDRMLAQEALLKSEQKYRNLFENTGTATFVIEEDFTISQANQKCVDLYGYSRAEIEGKLKTTDLVVPEDLEKAIRYHFERRKEGGQAPTSYEIRVKDRHGQVMQTLIQIGIIPETQQSIASIMDISELKKIEKALQDSEHQLRDIIDFLPNPALVIDNGGKVVFWNREMEKLTGVKAKEMIGKGDYEYALPFYGKRRPMLIDLVTKDDEKWRKKYISLSIEGNRLANSESYHPEMGEKGIYLSGAAAPLFDSEKKLVGAIETLRDITDTKTIEQALRQSESKYRSILENMGEGYYETDLKGNFTFFNDAVCKKLEYSREELIGMNNRSYTSPEATQRAKIAFSDLYRTKQPAELMDYEVITKSGKIVTLEMSIYLLKDSKGSPVGFWGIARDVTHRKKWEKKLIDSQQEKEAILNGMKNVAIELIDPDLNIMWANKVSQQRVHNCHQSIIGMRCCETKKDHSGPCENCLVEKAIKTKQFQEAEISRSDGHTYFLQCNPVLDSQEQLKGIVLADMDITDRKKAERALMESEGRFKSFFDSSPDGILLTDLNGRILNVNRSLTLLTGYNLDELVQRPFWDFIPVQYHAEIGDKMEKLMKGILTEEPLDLEYRRKDGKLIPLAVRGWVATDEESNPYAFGAFIKDISIEKSLIEDKAHLERQLQHTQKMEAIGTLAGGIAHDFNNILGGIIGFTELSLMELSKANNDKLKTHLNHVLAGGQRAKDLVQQILNFSRRDSKTSHLISVTPIVEEAVKLLSSTLPSKIEIQKNINVNLDRVMGDTTQIHQVIVNLCTNAYHAMRKTGGTLSIGLENVIFDQSELIMGLKLTAGEYLQLSVTDTGVGISDNVLERIFEPYFTTKKMAEGTGLGLSVTIGIIKNHTGAIDVESTLGKGSTFRIYLPVSTARQAKSTRLNITTPMGSNQKILVIDDEPFFLEVVRELLVGLGYQVTAEQSSQRALERIHQHPAAFDLIVTDQTMPEMTGVQLVAEIRRLNQLVPIILCTGFSEDINEQTARYYGISKFLHKPITRQQLAEAVHSILSPNIE